MRQKRARAGAEPRAVPLGRERSAVCAGAGTCPDCGAVCAAGTWSWAIGDAVPAPAARCPSCCSLRDRRPGGVLVLVDPTAAAPLELLAGWVRGIELREYARSPLHRVLALECRAGELRVLTSSAALARVIARELARRLRASLAASEAADGVLHVRCTRA